MAKIDGVIPPASWEVIGEKIKTILQDEIDNQQTLTNDNALNVTVWRERLVNFGKEEIPAINVTLARTGLDNQDAESVRASSTFFIDVYTKFKADSSNGGGANSSFLLQRLAGLVRAILESPKYKTLDFTPPFVQKRNFNSFTMGRPSDAQDGINVAMGRFEFEVVGTDFNETSEPYEIQLSTVVVKLGDTEIGHKFEYINNPSE